MDKDIAEKLVAALRSGEYGQATNRLRTSTGYCCLGVLCDLYVKENPEEGGWSSAINLDGVVVWNFQTNGLTGDGAVLPTAVQEWAGMNSDNGAYKTGEGDCDSCLSHDNDAGATFREIADFVEKRYIEL